MKTLWIILVLLVSARLCGVPAARFQQPVLVGELIAGVDSGFLFIFSQ